MKAVKGPRFKVVRAQPDEWKAARGVINECGQELEERFGFSGWKKFGEKEFEKLASRGDVFVAFDEGKVVATFTLTQNEERVAKHQVWADPSHRALYVLKMAVLPSHRKSWALFRCSQRIRIEARARECQAMRWDALEFNSDLVNAYRKIAEERGASEELLEEYGQWARVVFFEKIEGKKRKKKEVKKEQ